METAFAVVIGLTFATAIYLMLSRFIIRILLGVAILGNAVNLLLFVSGRLVREVPPIIGSDESHLSAFAANPLPQALILTAIVISFSFFAFFLVLAYRSYQELKTDDTHDMRFAEPENEPLPPSGY